MRTWTIFTMTALLVAAFAADRAGWLLSPAGAEEAAEEKKVEGDAEVKTNDLAEPGWPIGIKLPPEIVKGWKREKRVLNSEKANILVWTPPKAEKIRAAILVPNNTDSKNAVMHKAVRDVAKKHEIGIVYLRHFDGSIIERTNPPENADKMFQAVLDLVARETGIEEYRHAPWITFGKSSRGRFPFRTTWWFPDRVIASISYHGETPTWPMKDWSKVGDESVLHVAINGQEEWSGTWYRHVRPCMLNYHANTNWLTHQVVLHKVGHGNYVDAHGSKGWGKPVPKGTISCLDTWDYIAVFIDKAMELRVPEDTYPTKKPTKLKQVDRSSGLLIHPRAPEELLGMKWMAFRYKDGKYQIIPWPDEKHPVHDTEDGDVDRELLIRRASDVPKDQQKKMFWVADREQAKAWLKLHNVQGWDDILPPEEKPKKDKDDDSDKK